MLCNHHIRVWQTKSIFSLGDCPGSFFLILPMWKNMQIQSGNLESSKAYCCTILVCLNCMLEGLNFAYQRFRLFVGQTHHIQSSVCLKMYVKGTTNYYKLLGTESGLKNVLIDLKDTSVFNLWHTITRKLKILCIYHFVISLTEK